MEPHSATAETVTEALASGRESASLLHAIVSSSVDAIIGKTLDGCITSWNLGAEQMYGYTESEVMGRHISLLFPPDRLDELDDALARIAQGGRIEQHDTCRIRKNGTSLDVSVTIAPILDDAGVVCGASAIGRNITQRLALERERRELERRLNQSERLESLGRLAGGIAHDFNNLLAVIFNYANFASDELTDTAKVESYLCQIRTASERASELTRQLLSFARREVLQPTILDLNTVITEVEQILDRTLGEQVELAITLTPELWPIEADPGRLEQVLMNLTVNARDAMPDGGVLAVETANVEVDDDYASVCPGVVAGRYVSLRVSDTGCGMDDGLLEHVFEPFFTTKPLGAGTGLGLPTVFGIVSQAGGDIQIYSELGIGTTCTVLLPASNQAVSLASPSMPAGLLAGTETVVVVEDEDALREVARIIFQRNGYEVFACASGAEAVAFARKHAGTIDLLVTDVVMPRMSGTEVASTLQEMRPGLRVLYMSGYAQPVLGPSLGAGMSLLEKPFSERSLLIKVRGLLGPNDRTT